MSEPESGCGDENGELLDGAYGLLEKANAALREDDWKTAEELAGEALQLRLAELDGDEMHAALAPFYFCYGRSLVGQLEEADDASGGVSLAQILGGVDEVEQEGRAELEEAAWENIEVARSISEKSKDLKVLAKSHFSMGKLMFRNDQISEGMDEFLTCRKVIAEAADSSMFRLDLECLVWLGRGAELMSDDLRDAIHFQRDAVEMMEATKRDKPDVWGEDLDDVLKGFTERMKEMETLREEMMKEEADMEKGKGKESVDGEEEEEVKEKTVERSNVVASKEDMNPRKKVAVRSRRHPRKGESECANDGESLHKMRKITDKKE